MIGWEVYIEEFPGMRLGELYRKFINHQYFEGDMDKAKAKYNTGQFHRIVSRDQSTILQTDEDGMIDYWIPTRLVNEYLLHIQGLESWMDEFKDSFPRKIDEKRNI